MKEQNDIDWKLFSLLEGELNDEEAEALLSEIDLDEELNEEWALMQQTQLKPDTNTVYASKSKLKKRSTAIIGLLPFTWQQAVAAAAVITLAIPVWRYLQSNSDIDPTSISGSIENVDSTNSETKGPTATEAPVVEKVEVSEPDNEVKPPVDPAPNLNYTTKPKSTRTIVADAGQIQPKPNQTIEVPLMYPETNLVDGIRIERSGLPNQVKSIAWIEAKFDRAPNRSYQGVRPLLNSTWAGILKPFRNSKLQLEPVEKSPAFKIVYKSDKYYATAMLSLKPLN